MQKASCRSCRRKPNKARKRAELRNISALFCYRCGQKRHFRILDIFCGCLWYRRIVASVKKYGVYTKSGRKAFCRTKPTLQTAESGKVRQKAQKMRQDHEGQKVVICKASEENHGVVFSIDCRKRLFDCRKGQKGRSRKGQKGDRPKPAHGTPTGSPRSPGGAPPDVPGGAPSEAGKIGAFSRCFRRGGVPNRAKQKGR